MSSRLGRGKGVLFIGFFVPPPSRHRVVGVWNEALRPQKVVERGSGPDNSDRVTLWTHPVQPGPGKCLIKASHHCFFFVIGPHNF